VELRTAPLAASPVLDGVVGEFVRLPGGTRLRLVSPYPRPGSSPTGRGNRLWRAAVIGSRPVPALLARWGRPIAYGYLAGRYPLTDYQTVFASIPGSAEMPSAGRGFSSDLISNLAAAGVSIAPITLHTGLSSQDAGEAPQPEWFEVPAATARQVSATRQAGRRVIAVGTTVTRALESAAEPGGTVLAKSGWTSLVVEPGRGVRAVDGLITGWHNPDASHLLLVEAVAGAELTQRAYDAAVAGRYLWHEFGDAGLLLSR
jgi:S-adenosylmethionine:tRNA ribosyltransferase-isomerase